MSDKSQDPAVAIANPEKIGGPSHEKLREAIAPKSSDEIAADLRRRQFESIEEAIRQGEARSNKSTKEEK